VDLYIITFLENAFVKWIAEAVRKGSSSSRSNEISRLDDNTTTLPASYAQSRLWTEEEINPDLSRYNTYSQRKFTDTLDINALKKALFYAVDWN
jgi:hypothetical protein